MSRPKHPAARARRIVALASGASYLGLTASIAVATTLTNEVDDVAVLPSAEASQPDQLALQLDGAATPVPDQAAWTVENAGEAAGRFAASLATMDPARTTSTTVTSDDAAPVTSAPPAPNTSRTTSQSAAPVPTTAPATTPTAVATSSAATSPATSGPTTSVTAAPTSAPPTTQATTTSAAPPTTQATTTTTDTSSGAS